MSAHESTGQILFSLGVNLTIAVGKGVVAVLTAAGAAIYLLVASALRAPEIGLLRSLLARRRTREAGA